MRYNTTYTPKMTLKQTIKAIDKFKKEIIAEIHAMYSFTNVDPPLFLPENSELLLSLDNVTRSISFDFGDNYQVGTFLLSHSNWARNLLSKLDFQDGEGLTMDATTIWRDLPNNMISTSAKEEMTFQVRIDDEEKAEQLVHDLSQDIYEIFYNLANKAKKEFDIENVFPSFADYIPAQILENEMPNESTHQREIETALVKGAFILSKPGTRLFSSKVHSYLPPTLYDLNNFNIIVVKDRVNGEVLKIASIALMANGQQLSDQLGKYNLKEKQAIKFYSDLVKQEYKVIEIKINMPKLMMGLLGKGHIGEVQSGIVSKDVKTVSERYKVDIIK